MSLHGPAILVSLLAATTLPKTARIENAQPAAGSQVLSVNDPRPVSAAIDEIQTRCRCVITYEDPKWNQDQVVDISELVRHRSDVRPQVPRGGPLTFSTASLTSPEQIDRSVQDLLRTADGNGYGTFRLATDEVIHVIPADGSILAVPVTFATRKMEISKFVESILLAVERTGEHVVLATGPVNLLRTGISVEAHDEPANAVLSRVLLGAGRKVSWRLFYDFGMKKYFLNISVVD